MAPRTDLSELQRSFVAPPGLGRSRPREVRLTAGGWVVSVAALSLVALAVVVFVTMSSVAIRQANEQRLLKDTGLEVTAEVTRLWRNEGKSRQPWVAYRFELSGRVFAREAEIGLARWRTLHVGSPLPIRFPAAHPERSLPRGREAQAMPLWLPFVVSASIAAFGVACLFWLNRERRLVSDGRAAPAIVTKITTHHSSHGGTHRHMRYEFPLLSGAVASGKSSTSGKGPAVGSVICVLSDPDNPRRSVPYPVRLVRPETLGDQGSAVPRSARRPSSSLPGRTR